MEVRRLDPLLLAVLLRAVGDVVEPRGRPAVGEPVQVGAQPQVVVKPEWRDDGVSEFKFEFAL